MRNLSTILISILLSTVLAVLISRFIWKPKTDTPVNDGLGLAHAAAKGIASTVWVQDVDPESQLDSALMQPGSGIIISADGYILTNWHVVDEHKSTFVALNDKQQFRATLVGADTAIDVALLKVDAKNLPFLEFADSDSIRIGEQVIAVGNPHSLQSTVTSGIVSSRERPLNMPGSKAPYFIQTDVPINNGNSGGPLLNVRGQLIGMNIGFVTTTGDYEGFTMSIPGNIVKGIADQLREFGNSQKGSLKMAIRNVTKDDAAAAGMDNYNGIVIDAITARGSADLAGLQSLDVITMIDGQQVMGKKDFLEKLTSNRPGEVVAFDVNRGGKKMKIEVTLE
jgi:serine protease Do